MTSKEDQKKKVNKYVYIGCLTPVFIAFIIFLVVLFDKPDSNYTELDVKRYSDSLSVSLDSAETLLKYEDARQKIIKNSFTLSGCHIGLRNEVIQSLKDPDSFEHIGTQFWDKDDYLIVLMKYRAKNSFGGYVVSSVRANVSLDGTQIQILD